MPDEEKKVTAMMANEFKVGDIILERTPLENVSWGARVIGFVQALVNQSKGHYDTVHASVVTSLADDMVHITHVTGNGADTFQLNTSNNDNFFVFRANNLYMQKCISNAALDLKKDGNLKWSIKAAFKAVYNGIRNKNHSATPNENANEVAQSKLTICSQFVVEAIKKGINAAKKDEKRAEGKDMNAISFMYDMDAPEEPPINEDEFSTKATEAVTINKDESVKTVEAESTNKSNIQDFSLNIPSHSLPKVLEAALYKNDNFSMLCYTGPSTVLQQLESVIEKQIERLQNSPTAAAKEKGRILKIEYDANSQKIRKEIKPDPKKPYEKDVERATALYKSMEATLKMTTGKGYRQTQSYREVKDVATRLMPKLR